MLELPSFKYLEHLRGVIVIITTSEHPEYYTRWSISQKVCLPTFADEKQEHVLTRLWIPLKNFDKYQTIISDSLANHNKFYGSNLGLERLKLEVMPIYTDGKVVINGETCKMLNGKIYKRIRKRKIKNE